MEQNSNTRRLHQSPASSDPGGYDTARFVAAMVGTMTPQPSRGRATCSGVDRVRAALGHLVAPNEAQRVNGSQWVRTRPPCPPQPARSGNRSHSFIGPTTDPIPRRVQPTVLTG